MAKFEPDELLKKMRINKYAADMLIKSNQQDIAANTSKMAADWYKNWKKENGIPNDSNALPPVDSVPTWARPHLFPRAQAKDGMKIARDLGPGDMSHVTDKGFYLTEEDGIHGHVYQNEGGYLKEGNMYDSGIHGLPIPRAQLKIRGDQKVAMSPADVPLGDGLIYEAKTKMQQNLKQKYDMMLENGMMSEEEYHKQMQRTMGTKKK